MHVTLYKRAQDALDLKEVSAAGFSNIIRILFCKSHHKSQKFNDYKVHFENLWEKAAQDRRNEVLEAFRDYSKAALEKVYTDGCATTEERDQFSNSLKFVRDESNDDTDQISAQQSDADRSQNNLGGSGISTADNLFANFKYASNGPTIFEKLKARIDLDLASQEQSTPPPAEQKRKVLPMRARSRTPKNDYKKLDSYVTAPPNPEANTPLETNTPGKTPNNSWNPTPQSSTKSPEYRTQRGTPGTDTPGSDTRLQRPEKDRFIFSDSFSVPFKKTFATPSPCKRSETIWNVLGSATSDQSLPDPSKRLFRPTERLETTGSPPMPRRDGAQIKSLDKSAIPTSPPSAQGPKESSDGLLIERPRGFTQDIRKLLLQEIEPSLARIYILKAPEYFKDKEQCVKIGITKDVPRRIGDLSSTCGFTDLAECPRFDGVAIPRELAARVEKLCHLELRPFLRIMQCTKGENGANHTVRHEEWFAISERLAIQTVKRWLRFVELRPYHEKDPHSEQRGIKDYWREVIRKLQVETSSDRGIQYEELSKIYQKWIDDVAAMELPE